MKRVACSGPGCSQRRVHHERPDEARGEQLLEVANGHEGPAYCSFECAALDGAVMLQFDPLGCVVCGFPPEAHPGKLCREHQPLPAAPPKWLREKGDVK